MSTIKHCNICRRSLHKWGPLSSTEDIYINDICINCLKKLIKQENWYAYIKQFPRLKEYDIKDFQIRLIDEYKNEGKLFPILRVGFMLNGMSLKNGGCIRKIGEYDVI